MRSNNGFLRSGSPGRHSLFIPRTESNRVVRLVLDLTCPVRSTYLKYNWLLVSPSVDFIVKEVAKGMTTTFCCLLLWKNVGGVGVGIDVL